MTTNSHCLRYGHGDETSLHALRDCSFPRVVWVRIVLNQRQIPFFSLSLENWLKWNIENDTTCYDVRIPWNSFFSIIFWLLWKSRNMFVFSNGHSCVEDIVDKGMVWTRISYP